MSESARAEINRGQALARVLLWWAGLGLLSGTLELAAFVIRCRWLDPRNFNMSSSFPWMFPLSGLLVVGLPAALLAAIALVHPRLVPARRVAAFLLFPVALGVLFRAPISTLACLGLAAGLAYRLGGRLRDESRLRRADRLLRIWTACATLVYLSTLGLSRWEPPVRPTPADATSSRPPRDVLLLVLDTVRAQSLSLYGYERPTTPNLARLAQRGTTFQKAFATAPWTAPSHAGMFTGKWPDELAIGWDSPLEPTHRTLAEEFGARGYDTAGFVANSTYCSYETGLARGFDHYEDYDVTPRSILLCSSIVQRSMDFILKRPRLARALGQGATANRHRKSAARINRDFLAWLDHRSGSPQRTPYFAFLNYFDAHHPYFPPEVVPGGDFGRAPASPEEEQLIRTWWDVEKRDLSPEQVELGRDAYDRCLAYLDREVGRLVDELGRRGRLDSTLIIITADHGEHLGERSLYGHGTSLYCEELHVPLVMIAPGRIPDRRVIAPPVSLRDLPATVVDLAAPGGPPPFPGHSLAATWNGSSAPISPVRSTIAAPPEGDPNHGRSPASLGPLHSEVVGPYHRITDRQGREELYHLDEDPRETRNLARPDPEGLARAEPPAAAGRPDR